MDWVWEREVPADLLAGLPGLCGMLWQVKSVPESVLREKVRRFITLPPSLGVLLI